MLGKHLFIQIKPSLGYGEIKRKYKKREKTEIAASTNSLQLCPCRGKFPVITFCFLV